MANLKILKTTKKLCIVVIPSQQMFGVLWTVLVNGCILGDDNRENHFYNCQICDHYTGTDPVFCPDGAIPICCYNIWGTVHDSQIVLIGNIYIQLQDIYDKTGADDSSFICNNHPFLIKSCNPSLDMAIDEMGIAKDSTSMYQLSEWHMRAFHISFPQMKDCIMLEFREQCEFKMNLLILL